jgi:hypothetical protein
LLVGDRAVGLADLPVGGVDEAQGDRRMTTTTVTSGANIKQVTHANDDPALWIMQYSHNLIAG